MSGSPRRGARTARSAGGWPQWAGWGLARGLHAAALRAYDQIIGLELGDVAVDGCLTKAPCGGERAGPSPVDRRKGGLKRSVATEGYGIPLGLVSAGANRHDSPLLAPTLRPPLAQVRPLPGDAPATWTPATTALPPETCSPGWASTADRPQRRARAHPGRHAAGWWSEPTPG